MREVERKRKVERLQAKSEAESGSRLLLLLFRTIPIIIGEINMMRFKI